MHRALENGFLRIPNNVFEALVRARLSGGQVRIVLWVIRQTLGWNRTTTQCTWYQVARELNMDRGGVVRAGQRLLKLRILYLHEGVVGLEMDISCWQYAKARDTGRQAIPCVSDDSSQRKAMPGVIESDDACQRNRCQESSLFRRAKDSSKDKLKTYKKQTSETDDVNHPWRTTGNGERRHLADSALPIPGKYDRLSQNR